MILLTFGSFCDVSDIKGLPKWAISGFVFARVVDGNIVVSVAMIKAFLLVFGSAKMTNSFLLKKKNKRGKTKTTGIISSTMILLLMLLGFFSYFFHVLMGFRGSSFAVL